MTTDGLREQGIERERRHGEKEKTDKQVHG